MGVCFMRDTLTIGILSGLIGNVVKDASNYFIWRAKKTELLYGHLAGSMLSPPESVQESGGFIAGQLLDFTIGAAIGVPIVYLLKKAGKDNYLLKGAAAGLAAWGLLYGLGPNLGVVSIKPKMSRTHLSAFWNNLLYGLATAQAAVLLADSGLFPEKP